MPSFIPLGSKLLSRITTAACRKPNLNETTPIFLKRAIPIRSQWWIDNGRSQSSGLWNLNLIPSEKEPRLTKIDSSVSTRPRREHAAIKPTSTSTRLNIQSNTTQIKAKSTSVSPFQARQINASRSESNQSKLNQIAANPLKADSNLQLRLYGVNYLMPGPLGPHTINHETSTGSPTWRLGNTAFRQLHVEDASYDPMCRDKSGLGPC